MRTTTILTTSILVLVLFSSFALANLSSTTMTWFVATAKSISVTHGSPCASGIFFFPESKAFFDSDNDGNWAMVVPHTNRAGDTNCQTSAQAGMTVNNTGTSALNVDGNFSAGFSGADVNIVLKVWQGTGTGCGTNGYGGWENNCTASANGDATTAPGTGTCRGFNQFNETAGGRLVTSLGVFAAQQLCFSGDGNGFVAAGDHNGTFQVGSDFS